MAGKRQEAAGGGLKTIGKALAALTLLDEDSPTISVGEVSARLAMPKSTTSRLLASLAVVGLLELDPATRRYGAGPAAGRLGALYRLRVDPHQLIRQKMAELAKLTGHSCWMGVLTGREVVILYTVHGSHPVRYVIEPGSHLPAHSTAMGRALLAGLSDQEIRTRYALRRTASGNGRTFPAVSTILRDARQTRLRGWAEVAGDNFAGVGAVGCALPATLDQPVIGLSISYPLSSIDRREVPRLRGRLVEVVRGLRDRLNGTGATPSPTTARSPGPGN